MLVIKGVFYYDTKGNEVLVPHMTGDFQIVDCDVYKKMENIDTDNYPAGHFDDVETVTVDGETYYQCDYEVTDVDDWVVLSDVGNLQHFEESREFTK
jgi:hypothetical protein